MISRKQKIQVTNELLNELQEQQIHYLINQ